jgi:hypothetical protein
VDGPVQAGQRLGDVQVVVLAEVDDVVVLPVRLHRVVEREPVAGPHRRLVDLQDGRAGGLHELQAIRRDRPVVDERDVHPRRVLEGAQERDQAEPLAVVSGSTLLVLATVGPVQDVKAHCPDATGGCLA